MKKFLVILIGVIFIIGGGIALAYNDEGYHSASFYTSKTDKEEKPEGAQCPITTYTDQEICKNCHEMRKEDGKWGWHIKPQKTKNPKRLFRFPGYIQIVNGKAEGYFELDDVNTATFHVFCEYMHEIGMKKITIDIYSGGGSLFGGVAIASKIFDLQRGGAIVTTKIHAFAASAALVIFVASDVRLVNDYAILMWHELKTVDWPKWVTPSGKEDEARVLRLIQDNMNRYMSDKIKSLNKDEIDDLVHRMEWWMTGKEAVESGVATGYIE